MSPRKNLARPLRLAARYALLPESRGQELLREVPESNKAIALALGVTAPAVNQWRHGHSRPSDERARALEVHFGVPYASWFLQSDALRAALAKYGESAVGRV